MRASEFEALVHETKTQAQGQWLDILVDFGVDRTRLTAPNQPCPLCGGRDRFSFNKNDPHGFWFCRHCGHGDGLAFLERLTGTSFLTVLLRVRRFLGLPEAALYPREAQEKTSRVPTWLKEWEAATPMTDIQDDDPVALYLTRRGLSLTPGCTAIRSHPGLEYWTMENETAKLLGRFPAMVALLTNDKGEPESLHKTYLTPEGEKAQVPSPKKLAKARLTEGLIRLSPPTHVLGIAEGIETSLAVENLFFVPVWSAVSVGGFSRVKIPKGVERVIIYADHDANFAGQAGAYNLAARIKRLSPELRVDIRVPPNEGDDWADVALNRLGRYTPERHRPSVFDLIDN